MSGIGRLAAALILGIVLLGARAEAQDTSLMDMNMNMGCMLMAGMHEMQVSVYQSGAQESNLEITRGPRQRERAPDAMGEQPWEGTCRSRP